MTKPYMEITASILSFMAVDMHAVSTIRLQIFCILTIKTHIRDFLKKQRSMFLNFFFLSCFPKQEVVLPSSISRQQRLIHELSFPKFLPFFMCVRKPRNISLFVAYFNVFF